MQSLHQEANSFTTISFILWIIKSETVMMLFTLLLITVDWLQVRKRPLNKKELSKNEEDIIETQSNSLVVHETKFKVRDSICSCLFKFFIYKDWYDRSFLMYSCYNFLKLFDALHIVNEMSCTGPYNLEHWIYDFKF